MWLAFPGPLAGEWCPAGGAGATERPVLGSLPEGVGPVVGLDPGVMGDELGAVVESVAQNELILHGLRLSLVSVDTQAEKPLQIGAALPCAGSSALRCKCN